jgi:subtilisin family serine protease
VFSSFTNFGRTVDIAAPGSDIYATYPNNSYASISGTSMATPLVAAIIGQIRQAFPSMTARQAIDRVMYSADRLVTNWLASDSPIIQRYRDSVLRIW